MHYPFGQLKKFKGVFINILLNYKYIQNDPAIKQI